ncbi:FHA domain-containing protein [Mobilicoccus caccae]|uniref:FHA domain-containing protein n=1 Tax=Mobilicoccus caccae TaxID=1859295 RepID=UPI0024E04186|nr:FHA domain-containing protein [Mobilicoccus caccae]
MTRCPAGHESATADYCDVCGMPMSGGSGGAGVSPAASPAVPVSTPPSGAPKTTTGDAPAATQVCEHCSAVNAEDNLFCEVCGFDFTTGVMPRVEGGEPSFLPPVVPAHQTVDDTGPEEQTDSAGPDDAAGQDDAGEPAAIDQVGAGLEIDVADPDVADADVAEADVAEADVAAADTDLPAPEGEPADAEPAEDPGAVEPAAPAPVPDPVHAAPKPVNRPPSREVAGDWVVEVWIDPDWYGVQDTDEPCPSPAPPEIVRITGSDALIGRRSRSSVPDVDCGVDSAVSRKQALLTSDGRRWWIEDLDSSNGTWVGPAIGPLPSAPVTGRTEIDADDRIYVGAWTRLVLRPATPSEVEADSY